MTKASLTDRQTIASTPLALRASAASTKPGRCLAEHVGVKAPGSPNRATSLPLKMSSVPMASGPSAPMTLRLTDGIRSPTLMVIEESLPSG